MQIRGGRGYETEHSLAARGEKPIPVERVMRDCRINLIFEGSSEIMHLFMAREAVDKHLQVAGAMIDPKTPLAAEARRAAEDPRRSTPAGTRPLWLRLGALAALRRLRRARAPPALRRAQLRASSRARASTAWLVYQAKMERKQAFLFRCVDIVMELFAMAAAMRRAKPSPTAGPRGRGGVELADLFCRRRAGG